MKKIYSAPSMTNYGGLEVVTQNQGDQTLSDFLTLSNIPGIGSISVPSQGSIDVNIDVLNPPN